MNKSGLVLMVFWAWLAAACVGTVADRPAGGTVTKHFQGTLFALAERETVSVEVLLDEQEYMIGRDMIGIVIHNRHDRDVEGATVTAVVNGLSEPLAVKEKGGGLYLAPSQALPKEGAWELQVSVRKGEIEDRARFTLPDALLKRLPAGSYAAEELKGKR